MTIRGVSLLLLLALSAGDPLQACGEKYLMRSRGTRFQSPGLARPSAAILVYANPAQNLPKALSNVPFDATLRKAGYRPTVVTTPDAFDSALVRGGWDLVLVDVADTALVSGRAAGAKAPLVLPVMYNATRGELDAAKKQHAHILKAPTKNQAFLDAIDDVLVIKPSGRARAGG